MNNFFRTFFDDFVFGEFNKSLYDELREYAEFKKFQCCEKEVSPPCDTNVFGCNPGTYEPCEEENTCTCGTACDCEPKTCNNNGWSVVISNDYVEYSRDITVPVEKQYVEVGVMDNSRVVVSYEKRIENDDVYVNGGYTISGSYEFNLPDNVDAKTLKAFFTKGSTLTISVLEPKVLETLGYRKVDIE